MSKSQMLRALVNARLNAAAEEIFSLFERTIVEYEEELCRCKNENQRKQRLLDAVLNPRVQLSRVGAGVQTQTQLQTQTSPSLYRQIKNPAQIKEEPKEQSIEQEIEPLSEFITESSDVCVKTEEPAQLQQSEDREETHEENIISDTEDDTDLSSNSDSDSDDDSDDDSSSTDSEDDFRRPLNCSDALMETGPGEFDGQISCLPPTFKFEPEVSNGEPYGEVFQCSVCSKTFESLTGLRVHSRVHTNDCPICEKRTAKMAHDEEQVKPHSSEGHYSCPFCMKYFPHMSRLKVHMRVHTGEKPYSCTVCNKTFARQCGLIAHQKTHMNKKSCVSSLCNKH